MEKEYKKRIIKMLRKISGEENLCKVYTFVRVLFENMEAHNE